MVGLTGIAAGLGVEDPVGLARRAQIHFSNRAVCESSLRDVVAWMREHAEEPAPAQG